jgi:hypothetical protein
MDVSATPRGAAEARRRLSVLAATVPATIYSSIRLLVSELVSNKPAHVGQGVTDDSLHVLVQTSEAGVRVELRDSQSGRPERAQTATQEEMTRWDVILLEELTSEWGTLEDRPGDVWFEIPYDASTD